jgi:hypothetical protein
MRRLPSNANGLVTTATVNFHRGTRHAQCLQVGVGGDELDALDSSVDHAVDGVASASAYTDDFDFGVVASFLVKADANVCIFFHVDRLNEFACTLTFRKPRFLAPKNGARNDNL